MDNTLSIVMPNYNHGHLVAGALDSVLGQSFPPLEVIVIDDASSDNSVEVIEHIVKRDGRVRFLRNQKNIGAIPTFNNALKQVRGSWVYAMAADDRVLPGFFEKSMKLLGEHPQAALCSADMNILDSSGKVISEYRAAEASGPAFFSPAEVLAELYKNPKYIIGTTTIFRRAALDEVGGFPTELHSLCDWFVERAIALKYGACYIPEVLCSWRYSEKNLSQVSFDDPGAMLDLIDRTVELMRSDRFRNQFPAEFVSFWSKSYGQEVVDAAQERLAQDRYTLMERVSICAPPTGIISRVIRRLLWSITGLGLSWSKFSLEKRLRAFAKN
jgi:glycosyltransferase involved in cell wall biosynthesis